MLEIEIKLTDYCNLSCKHCYAQARPFVGKLDEGFYSLEYVSSYVKRVFDFIDYCVNRLSQFYDVRNHLVDISLMGGEPLLVGLSIFRLFLDEIYDEADSRGFTNLHVTTSTNGLLLDDTWLEFFLENRSKISLAVAYDPCIRFRDCEQEKQWLEKIELLKHSGLDFTLNMAVTSYLVRFPVWEFVQSVGVEKVDIAPFLPVGRGSFFREQLGVRCSVLSSFLKELLDTKPDGVTFDTLNKVPFYLRSYESRRNSEVFLNGWGPCWNKFIIDIRGNIYHECIFPESLANIFADNFTGIFVSSKFVTLCKEKLMRRFCMECEFYNFCLGGCVALTCFEDEECRGLKSLLIYLKTKGECNEK